MPKYIETNFPIGPLSTKATLSKYSLDDIDREYKSIKRTIRHAGFVCIQTYPIKAEMSVSMPLQQAKTPIHVDLVIVCKKQNNSRTKLVEKSIVNKALKTASCQVS